VHQFGILAVVSPLLGETQRGSFISNYLLNYPFVFPLKGETPALQAKPMHHRKTEEMNEYFQNFLQKINGNGFEALFAATVANLMAQLIKTSIVGVQKRKFNLAIFFATGGMPSSHSSTVVALAASIGLIDGFSSVTFAIAAGFATIVMYDAAGVRRAASRQAVLLNQIVQNLFQNNPELNKGKLKEFLGHTPTEVFAGAGLGIAVSVILRWWISHNTI